MSITIKQNEGDTPTIYEERDPVVSGADEALEHEIDEALDEQFEKTDDSEVVEEQSPVSARFIEITKEEEHREEVGQIEIPDHIAEGIKTARENGKKIHRDRTAEELREQMLAEQDAWANENRGTPPPNDPPPLSYGGDNNEPTRWQRLRSSAWRFPAMLLAVAALLALLIYLLFGPRSVEEIEEQSVPPTTSFVEQSTFEESQAAQDARIATQGRQIDENANNISSLNGRFNDFRDNVPSPDVIANEAKRGVEAAVADLNRRVNVLEMDLADEISRREQTVGQIGERFDTFEGEVRRIKDTADVAYQVSDRQADVLAEHNGILKDHETRLAGVEKVAGDNAMRLLDIERKFDGLSTHQAFIIRRKCDQMNRESHGLSALWTSVNVKHYAEILALVDGDVQAAKQYCAETYPHK